MSIECNYHQDLSKQKANFGHLPAMLSDHELLVTLQGRWERRTWKTNINPSKAQYSVISIIKISHAEARELLCYLF